MQGWAVSFGSWLPKAMAAPTPIGYLIYINCGSQDYRGYSYLGVCAPILVQLQVFVKLFYYSCFLLVFFSIVFTF
ncbi:putative integral membrane protein [Brugia pahangi]